MVKIEYFLKAGASGEMTSSIWLKTFVILLTLYAETCVFKFVGIQPWYLKKCDFN